MSDTNLDAAIAQDKVKAVLYERMLHTPDLHDLDMYDNHLIFVFDGCKSTFPNHHLIVSKTKYLGRGRTVESSFLMKGSKHYPFVKRLPQDSKENREASSKVLGEVYAFRTSQLMFFDQFMVNNFETERKSTLIELLDQPMPLRSDVSPRNVMMKCWMYFITTDHSAKFFNTLSPCLRVLEKGCSPQDWAYEWREKREYDL